MRDALVGRADEIAAIGDALDRARSGRTALVLVCGEAGIGKSRLAEEAATIAESREMAVAWGRAWEAGGAPAFWPWIQVLRVLRRRGVLADDAPEPARLLPMLDDPAQVTDNTDGERFALLDGALCALAAAAEVRPLLVVLEDLHASDRASLQLLAFLASHLRDAAIAVLCTYRDRDVSVTCGPLLEQVCRTGTVLRPRPLSPSDVAALAGALPADDVARLHRATAGNPLFVTELLRASAPGATHGGGWHPLPDGVRSVIRERLAELPAQRRAILEVAAVIGSETGLPLLAAAGGVDPAALADELAACREVGLLVESAPGHHAFRHGLFADALRQDCPPTRRVDLHRRIAGELERLHAGDPAAPHAEIAHHLIEAGPTEAARAVESCRRAAAQASAQLAFDQAAALLAHACAAADIAAPADAPGRAELLIALGRARILAGDIVGGQAACADAASLARSCVLPELLARAALGYGMAFTFGTTDRVLVEMLEEAMHALPRGDSPLRARLLARLASALQPARDPERPMQLARSAIEMARTIGDERARLEVFHAATSSLVKYGPPRERAALDEETCDLAERLGEFSIALRSHARLAFDHLELGDPSRALRHIDRYEDRIGSLRHPGARWPAPMFRAMLALYEGRFSDHSRHLAEATALADLSGEDLARHCLNLHHIGVLRARGEEEGLAGARSELWQRLPQTSHIYERATRWMIAARVGDARALADLSGHDPQEIVRLRDPVVATWISEAVAVARDRAWAEALLSWLQEIPDQVALQAMHGMFVEGPIARALYLLADVLDRTEQARRHFESALAAARRQRARPLEARIHYEWGIIQSARSDETSAHRSLSRARELAAELGLALLPRIDRALAPLASATSNPDIPAASPSLVCEGEYWTISGEGGTVRLKNSRGVALLEQLLAQPGREIHVLELSGASGTDTGDAGEVIDREARQAYRARASQLEVELAQAEEWNDPVRAERARVELDALRSELVRAIGLGGRSRRTGAAAERARVNVQRRLSDAISRITAGHAKLGAHLARCIRTGTYCSYDPER